MRKRVVRIAIWGAVLAVIVAATLYSLRPKPILVDVAVVKRGPLKVFVQDDGITRIRERYVVSSPLTGRLLRISYDVGDSVIAGETVLARMQPTDPELLDPRALAQARARVSAAERRLEAVRAELAKAEAGLDFAEVELGRLRKLKSTAAASLGEFDEAELAFRSRKEEVRAAGFNVEIAEYELEQQRAALLITDSATQISGSDSSQDSDGKNDMELSIAAPISGRVLRIYQESSAVVAAGAPLMEIGDPTDLEIVVDVLSRDAVRIDMGDEVILENWGRADPLNGRVRRVEPSGFTKTSALGVEEQRVNVIIDINDPVESRRSLGDNFRVDAKIIVWQDMNALQVPTSALFRGNDQWSVFRIEQGVATLASVQIGQNNGIQAQVLSGLQDSDVVITHPGDSISEGVQVSDREAK